MSGVDRMRRLSMGDLFTLAADLISEDAENSEYDRGITELLCDVLGISADEHKDSVLAVLRGWSGWIR